MQKNITILNELKELESLLADIPSVNVFSVPDGYFDTLAPSVLLHIHQNEITGSSTSKMEVPAGYFDSLADNIMSRIKAETENFNTDDEVNTSFIDTVKHINVYSVPEGYFNSIAGNITNSLQDISEEAGESSVLTAAKKINVYAVPDGYFNTVAENVITKIKRSVDDTEESNILSGINKINIFTVPEGYFDTVATNVLNKVKSPAKLVSMGKRPVVFKYAIAAAITGILGFSLFNLFDKSNNGGLNKETAAMVAKANEIIKTNSFDKGMETLTEADIMQYLQLDGEDMNAALAVSALDDTNLPEEEQYLYDDNALDNFLKDLNISENNLNSN